MEEEKIKQEGYCPVCCERKEFVQAIEPKDIWLCIICQFRTSKI